jgi:hypothetical protein
LDGCVNLVCCRSAASTTRATMFGSMQSLLHDS